MKMWTKLTVVFAGVILIAALLSRCGFAALSEGTEAPNFKATTLAGKQFELKDLRGRVVLLDFWATWCPPCQDEVPQLEKLWQRYKDKGLVVLGIAIESGGPKEVGEFVRDWKLTYWQVADPRKDIARKYGVRLKPTTYIIDTRGIIRSVDVGYGPGLELEFEKQIKQLLPSPEALKKLKPLEQPTEK